LTEPVRKLLKANRVHDFEKQGQGEENKVSLTGVIFNRRGDADEIKIALYRPITKHGDPRIWPYGLKKYASPDDVLAIFCHEGRIFLQNLSIDDLVELQANTTPLDDFLSKLQRDYDKVANELLDKLRIIASSGPLRSTCEGDTAIGRAIETALGININSYKTPDYKGIEIKSKRSGTITRSNLFAQVPNWDLSRCKSSAEILARYGYDRGVIRKLYCTVCTTKVNAQGLILDLDLDKRKLDEIFASEEKKKRFVFGNWKSCINAYWRNMQKHFGLRQVKRGAGFSS
jgi:hypothetical protein